jgi:hypothetical protein
MMAQSQVFGEHVVLEWVNLKIYVHWAVALATQLILIIVNRLDQKVLILVNLFVRALRRLLPQGARSVVHQVAQLQKL